MRMIKLLGLALMATLAFSAIGAIGAGSASALRFLTESGKLLLFTLESLTKPLLSTAGGKVNCESLLGHGFVEHNTDRAHKILLTFHGCKLNEGSEVCKSTQSGEPEGLITTLELDALLVTLLASLDKYGLVILSEEHPPHLAKFVCGILATLVTVLGSVVGEFEESLKESEENKKEKKVAFEHKLEQTYWTLEGLQTAKLDANPFGVFEPATQQVLVDIRADGGVRLCSKVGAGGCSV
jgi:hypothetical protein